MTIIYVRGRILIIKHANGDITGKSYKNSDDAKTVAMLCKDWLESEGNKVTIAD